MRIFKDRETISYADTIDVHDHAFVLFVVLIAVVAISGLAVALSRNTTIEIRTFAAEASTIRAEAAAHAGVARALASLEDRADRLGLSPYKPDIEWKFDDISVRLRMRQESSKVDILHGNIDLVTKVIMGLFQNSAVQAQVLDRVKDLRLHTSAPERIEAILPSDLRVSNDVHILDDHFTLFLDHQGVDPVGATAVVKDALLSLHPSLRDRIGLAAQQQQVTPNLAADLGNDYALPVNLFTIDAIARLPNGVTARRRALITLDSGARFVSILRDEAVSP